MLVSVCSLWTLSPALAVPSTKNPALRELDEHLQINLRQTSKAEQCWKALSMIAEILLPLLLYDIVCKIYILFIIIIMNIFVIIINYYYCILMHRESRSWPTWAFRALKVPIGFEVY